MMKIAILVVLACICNVQAKCRDSSHRGSVRPMTSAIIAKLDECHHEARAEAADYHSNMNYIVWNAALANFAASTSTDCNFGHTTNQCRSNIGGFPNVGENIACSGGTGESDADVSRTMCQNWVDEKGDYNAQQQKCNPGKVCGHYTQIIWGATTDYGCALVSCPAGSIFGMASSYLVCNYGPAGNFGGQLPAGNAAACKAHNACGDPHAGRCFVNGGGKVCKCNPGFHNGGGSGTPCVSGNGAAPTPVNTNKCGTTSNPCNGHGTCSEAPNAPKGYTCSCSTGWDHTYCDHQTNNCVDAIDCNGHGKCKNGGGCNCNSGWAGNKCGMVSNPCAGSRNPCHHGSTCKVVSNQPVCTCKAGWSGPTCDTQGSGHWTDTTNGWPEMRAKVEQYRQQMSLTKVTWSQQDADDAKSDSQPCSMSVDSNHHGLHGEMVYYLFICGTTPGSNWGSWIANTLISRGAWPTHNRLLNAGAAISKTCRNKSCGGSKMGYMIYTFDYMLYGQETEGEVNFNYSENSFVATDAPAVEQMNFPAVVLGVACVVLAAAVVVLAIKLRKQPVVEDNYSEMA